MAVAVGHKGKVYPLLERASRSPGMPSILDFAHKKTVRRLLLPTWAHHLDWEGVNEMRTL